MNATFLVECFLLLLKYEITFLFSYFKFDLGNMMKTTEACTSKNFNTYVKHVFQNNETIINLIVLTPFRAGQYISQSQKTSMLVCLSNM